MKPKNKDLLFNKKKDKHKSIHFRIFAVFIGIAVFINVTALSIGALFLTHSIKNAVNEQALLNESALKDIPSGILLIGIITLVLSLVAAIIASITLGVPYKEVDRLRREAEIASISKSTFLANMSHEIRTPMNSILGFTELALDNEVTHKTRDYLTKIQTNAEWLLQIINDILDISKIESGKMELENIPFDIHELFASCRTLVIPKAVEKGIMLHFYAEPSVGKRLLGDPTRLRQVFVNLLSNAIKFTHTGMVKLLSEIIEMRDDTATIYFEIKDSGIGMTSEHIARVFDPFSQAETGTTRKYGGTGLGLSISKNIVEMMGGRLYVESTIGVGSKFSFSLTFNTIDVTEEQRFEKKIILSELEKPLFEGEILLCEDNIMNQQVICEQLARVGLKTVVAENGKIGVDMFMDRLKNNEKLFDLVFMDMHMPVMDGLEASKKINELKTGVPVVAMTANIMANDIEIYKTSGMNDCVGKPFTSQELWSCLMKYFTPIIVNESQKSVKSESDSEFQRSLQLYFVRSNRNKYTEIVKALEAHDIKLAHRLAHTLKGNAGQIGKIILQKAAEDVEHQLKDGTNLVSSEQLKTLDNELMLVINELSSLLKDSEREPKENEYEPSVLDPEKTRNLFYELELLLRAGNPDCINFTSELRLIPGSEKLIQQMEDFEFADAILTITELKERMDIK